MNNISDKNKLIEEIDHEFSSTRLKKYANNYHLSCQIDLLRNTLALLKNKYEFVFLVDFYYEEKNENFIYIIKNLDYDINFIIEVKKGPVMISMKKVFCGVVWAEKVYAKNLQIEFRGHVYRKLNEGERFFNLNIFPEFDYTKNHLSRADEISFHRFSPLYINFYGFLALDLEIKDDFVTRAKIYLHPEGKKIFYTAYSGERVKFLEHLKVTRSMVFFESIILFYKSLEESCDYSVDQETQLHRMIFLELERIKFIFHQLYLYFNSEKIDLEKSVISSFIQKINDEIISPAIIAVIHSRQDFILGAEFIRAVSNLADESMHLADNLKKKINFSSALSKEEPYKYLEAGISGDVLRNFGIDFDQRIRQKYFLYDKVEIKSNLGTSAWVEDLYQLKIQDLEESSRTVKHLLRGLSSVSHPLMIATDVLESDHFSKEEYYYADLEGASGLSSVSFRLNQSKEIQDLHFRSEIAYRLQKFEYVEFPETKEQFFKKLYASPLFLLES